MALPSSAQKERRGTYEWRDGNPLPGRQIPRFLDVSVLVRAAATPHVEILTSQQQMAEIAQDWRALEADAGRHFNVFQSFDWCNAWAKIYTGAGTGVEPFIVVIRDRAKVSLIWPMMRNCAGPVCALRWLSDPYGQYGDILIARDADRQQLLEKAWQTLQGSANADVLRLRHVREDAAAFDFLQTKFRSGNERDRAPFLRLDDYEDEAAYEKRYTKIQRRRRRKIRAQLEKQGELTFELIDTGPRFDALVDDIVDHKRNWLRRRGLFSKPLTCPGFARFIKTLAATRGNGVKTLVSLMQSAGKPVSYEIGLRFKGAHLSFITAHHQDQTDASPARLHMDMSQRRALKDRLRIFDLMLPADPHKLSWSNASIGTCDFHAPLSLKGRLYGWLYLEAGRPLLRRIYRNAPSGLRRLFARLLSI